MDIKSDFGNLAVVLIAFIGAFFLFNKDNISTYKFPELTKEGIIAAGADTLGKAGSTVKEVSAEQAGKLFQNVSDKASDLVDDAILSVQAQVLNSLKKTVDKKFQSIGQGIGVDFGSSGSSQSAAVPTPIMFSIKSQNQAYFTIKNRETGMVTYEIDWKDGKIDKGQVGGSLSKTVSHSWSKPGEYEVEFRINSGKEVRGYQILVSII